MKNNLLNAQVTELKDTIPMMLSDDYKERFKAEYNQVLIRYQKLKTMLHNWDSGSLNFEPTCPRSLYDLQIKSMQEYLTVLEARACIEGITNIETEPEPESIPDNYYVRLITEADKEQVQEMDEGVLGLDCVFEIPNQYIGYGLFEKSQNSSVPDELIGFSTIDKCINTRMDIDNFKEHVKLIQKQFPTYDFSQAAIVEIEPYPTDKKVCQFFLQQVLEKYNQPAFIENTTYCKKDFLKEIGCISIEHEWLYLPKEILEHRIYFTCENCSYFNANSKTCQNKLGPQYNYKCRPDKICRYHHQYDIDIE